MKFRLLFLASILPLLCSCTNLVWTSKPVITKPTDHDFHFVGKWEQLPNPRFRNDDPPYTMTITRDAETKTKYTLNSKNQPLDSKFAFTVSQHSDDPDYAIVQIRMSGIDPNYYFAYALRKEDRLYIWTIESDKLVKLIKETELNSVIDRGGWGTNITADPTKLLKMLTEHSVELASKQPTTYKLIQ
ncbi:hypothetical protein OAG71_00695 [bacterium]|nr:hypothetical protein [bacterium]